jgi:hypothetical protein
MKKEKIVETTYNFGKNSLIKYICEVSPIATDGNIETRSFFFVVPKDDDQYKNIKFFNEQIEKQGYVVVREIGYEFDVELPFLNKMEVDICDGHGCEVELKNTNSICHCNCCDGWFCSDCVLLFEQKGHGIFPARICKNCLSKGITINEHRTLGK